MFLSVLAMNCLTNFVGELNFIGDLKNISEKNFFHFYLIKTTTKESRNWTIRLKLKILSRSEFMFSAVYAVWEKFQISILWKVSSVFNVNFQRWDFRRDERLHGHCAWFLSSSSWSMIHPSASRCLRGGEKQYCLSFNSHEISAQEMNSVTLEVDRKIKIFW